MPEWTGQQQLTLLLQSCVFGVCLGFAFDFFNLPSKMHRRRSVMVFLCDVAFFALSALATFFFSLAVMDGRMHPLLFCGAFLGMIVQHLAIGRLFGRALVLVGRFLYGAFDRLLTWIGTPFRLGSSVFSRGFSAARIKIGKNAKKSQKKSRFFQKNS